MSDIEAAGLLWRHWQAGTTIDSLPAALRPTDRAGGYAVQACLPDVGQRKVVGWKIAATSAAGQRHIGVDGPLAGRILSGQVDPNGAEVSLAGNHMRVVEPEFAFRIGRTVPPRNPPYSVSDALNMVESLHPALELPDSRFKDFARAGVAQLLADNACAHRFIFGSAASVEWRQLDLRAHRVRASWYRGDQRGDRYGDGSAVLGDPRDALAWLVNELSSLGLALEAGQFVSTGTCMPPVEVQPGDRVEADYGVLGTISVRLTA